MSTSGSQTCPFLKAEQQVRIADEKLANVAKREKALERKQPLIVLAQQQLSASQGVLQKLEDISPRSIDK